MEKKKISFWEKLARKALFWLFRKRVRGFAIARIVTDVDVAHSRGDVVRYTKEDMAQRIGGELMKDGVIEIEEEYFPEHLFTRYIARLYAIRLVKTLTPKE